MNKSLWKNNIKEIIKTRRRFLSILIMAFLGVGFFSGLVSTSPDILDSLDSYTDNNKMFDINIISTLGLTDEDIYAIKEINGIDAVYGLQTKDSLSKVEEKESICKVIEYNENINTPEIILGRLPEKPNECLLDKNFTITENIENYIGKTIILENDDKNTNDTPIFTQKEFKIVGIAISPLYISNERGNTSIGSGNISYFIYTKDTVINLEYYTEICAKIKGTSELVTNSNEYLDLVNPIISKIESIKEEREEIRYNELISTANIELNNAQNEFNSKKADVDAELAKAEKQINDAKKEITIFEKKITVAEEELKTQENSLNKQFLDAENKIKVAEKQIDEKETEFEKSKIEIEKNKTIINNNINQINLELEEANNTLIALEEQKQQLIDTSNIDFLIEQTKGKIETLTFKKVGLTEELQNINIKLSNGESEISKAKTELDSQKNTLEKEKATALSKISSAKQEIKINKENLQNGKTELSKKETEFENGKTEATSKLNDAQSEINEAKDRINKIEKATWYIQDRLDNTGYTNIFDAIKTMSNIAKLFPIIFYLVAVLLSLTSMTRMIEEERIEIGTLKSLGYTNLQIISKYVLYSFLACIIGGILGMSIGFYLLPKIVWSLYSTIYTIPKFKITYQYNIGFAGTLIAFACIGGATIAVAYKELKEMPAVLMRPKPPKNGKKIFLEKITFIWKKLNFSKKITIRNIFRYKKRAIMTIVGIAGCTGLMLTGFGIKDSIVDIPTSQYGETFKYETSISLTNTEHLQELNHYLSSSKNIEDYAQVCASTGKVENDEKGYDVNIFVPESNEAFDKICNLKNPKSGEKLNLTNEGIILTDKVADFLKINSGDEITLIDSDNVKHTLKVTGITENHVSHYVYMSKEFYEANIKSYKTNIVFVNMKNISDMEKDKISEEILNIDGVGSVSNISNLISAINDMLSTINYVVLILVISSALLAFVVLYNLANINIGERQREIATLKVLGFYDREVDNYINKENIIFTITGIFLGLIFGYFLTNAVVASVEIDKLKFIKHISASSYLYAAIITFVFSLIVNKIIHFVLKKIDMIESLKSVE